MRREAKNLTCVSEHKDYYFNICMSLLKYVYVYVYYCCIVKVVSVVFCDLSNGTHTLHLPVKKSQFSKIIEWKWNMLRICAGRLNINIHVHI